MLPDQASLALLVKVNICDFLDFVSFVLCDFLVSDLASFLPKEFSYVIPFLFSQCTNIFCVSGSFVTPYLSCLYKARSPCFRSLAYNRLSTE